jgi:RsiW-degrading membrane proteinase PrsW (M82 family)
MAAVAGASLVLRRLQKNALRDGNQSRVWTYFLLSLALFEGWASPRLGISSLWGWLISPFTCRKG